MSHALPQPARFCPRCATEIPAPPEGEPPRCPRGDFTWWPDPKVATGVVVERDGRILLVRRNHEPAMGEWSFPSGFVDAGEVVEAAAAREVWEETGLGVRLEGLLGVYSEAGDPVIFVAFAGAAEAGEPAPGPEATEARFFEPDALPPLPFPHDDAIIEAWRAHRVDARGRVDVTE